jgi:hypothetical protein
MSAYQNPYTNQVVNATLANYDQNANNQLNALRASRGAGSAFGDRANLSDGSFLNQSDLNRVQTEAQLRNAGFNTAAGYGMQDANRFLQGDMTNAANALAAAQTNAANNLAAQQYNNTLNSQSQQFNINSKLANAGMDINAINQLGQNITAQNNMNNNYASSLANLGGMNFNQALAGLSAGTPLFGSQSNTQGQHQGQSSGYGSGSSSSKGFSLPISTFL